MSNKLRDIIVGSVYYMNFDGCGSEQSGWRPGVVFSNNKANCHSPNIIALPCTSSIKKLSQPTHVFLHKEECGLVKDSVVLCENPQRMSKSKIGSFITILPREYIKKIAIANLLASSMISFIPYDELASIWTAAGILNKSKSGGGIYV